MLGKLLFTLFYCTSVALAQTAKEEKIVRGPCDCSTSLDIQCRNLHKSQSLTQMMENARKFLASRSFSALGPGKNVDVNSVYVYGSHFADGIRSNFLDGLGVHLVVMDDTNVDGLVDATTGRAFISGGSNIKTLDISRCDNFRPSSWTDMSNLKSLTGLRLVENRNFSLITNMMFSNPPENLTYVDLNSNGIEKLADRAFENLKNLRVISLANNNIKKISRNMFADPLLWLEAIRLENNRIEYLPLDAFSFMPSIKEINLNNNRLKVLQGETWSSVWPQLQRIYLEGNELDCICRTMKWFLNKRVGLKSQIVTGKCVSPFLAANKQLESLVSFDVGCHFEQELS